MGFFFFVNRNLVGPDEHPEAFISVSNLIIVSLMSHCMDGRDICVAALNNYIGDTSIFAVKICCF